MRPVLLIIFATFVFQANAQLPKKYKEIRYTDTVNLFSIIFPADWTFEERDTVFKGIAFSASRVPVGKADYAKENFNINVIKTPKKDLEKTFSDLVRYLTEGGGNTKFIKKGDTILNGRKFKWLIESHNSPDSKNLQLHNYDFVTIRDGKTFILTMTTFSNYFDTVKPLFDKIAGSFILFQSNKP
jgi:hypothetical protein